MPQTNFYIQIAENILRHGGFGALTDEQIKQYAPQIAFLLEERVGLELLPKLNEEQAKQMVGLAEKETTTEEEWRGFWAAAVPNFEEVVAGIVGEFVAEADKQAAG